MEVFHYRNPAINAYRFYTLTIYEDLFGHCLLERSWGRLGTNGQSLTETCTNYADALEKLRRLRVQKIKKGYTLV
jgi:predicted DNA-binding WGR domain protein